MSNERVTIAQKVDGLTDKQIKEMAKQLGRPYLQVVQDLQRMKERSLYYQSDKAKEAAKAYRERAKARAQALKSFLS